MFRSQRQRIGLQRQYVAVGALDLVFIKCACTNAGQEYLPHANAEMTTHGMTPSVPRVERPHNADAARVRRPHREHDAGNAIDRRLVRTESARTDIEIVAVPTSELAESLGSIKVANMIMLGALVRASGMISYDTMVENLAEILGQGRAKLLELNKKALAAGYDYAKD